MDSIDPVVVFFEKSVIQSITLLRKWDFIHSCFQVPKYIHRILEVSPPAIVIHPNPNHVKSTTRTLFLTPKILGHQL